MFSFLKSKKNKQYLSSIDNRGGWFPIIHEPFGGAWQKNIALSRECILAFSAVYSCVTLIASDIAKLPIKLVEQDDDGIWTEIKNTLAPTLKNPNAYQNRIQFFEQWLISKLTKGNVYVWKQRDERGKITALYVLDACRVFPMVTPEGEVFYKLAPDNMSNIEETIIVPATEIIHDRMPSLFHPLCGTSPIYACGLSAAQGLKIQQNSEKFFENMSQPSGVLVAPGPLPKEKALELKKFWQENYSGKNAGKTAIIGDGMKYEPMTINAHDAQLIEQLKWTAGDVASCFHIPAYKIGVGTMPTYNNAEIFNQIYYSDCLQWHLESIELALDEGLELPDTDKRKVGVEFDTDALLRMDTETRYKTYGEGISKGWMKPNEARKREDLKPVEGGDTPYLQQQNFSLAALSARDKKGPPPTPGATPTEPSTPPAPPPEPSAGDPPAKAFCNNEFLKEFKEQLQGMAA